MKKIMLVCCGGMSTSLMVTKMKNRAKTLSDEIEIFALAECDALRMISQVDVIMLGPQVSYALSDFQDKAKPHSVPVKVIDTVDYGRMNGEKVLAEALRAIKEAV